MNLLLYQYISCQQENNGVQVLSELAGTAQYLDSKYSLVMLLAMKRTPSASIEEKEIGIIWHYHSSSEF
ncbi:11327_t:CDS:2, partial [Gigaspora rosea]